MPRNGGGFVGLLLCLLQRFPRNVRISEDRDQSRGLLAGATSDAEPLSPLSLSDLSQVRTGPLRRGSASLAPVTRGPRSRRTAMRPPSLPFRGKSGTVPATGVPRKPLRVYPVPMAGKVRQGARAKAKGPRAQAAEITDVIGNAIMVARGASAHLLQARKGRGSQ